MTRLLMDKLSEGPPRTLYHGTAARNIPAILEDGLLPASTERSVNDPGQWGTEGDVSLSDTKQGVYLFAMMAETKGMTGPGEIGNGAVVVVDTAKAQLEGVEFYPTSGISALGEATEWIVRGSIPPSAIAGWIERAYGERNARGKRKMEEVFHST